MSTSRILFSAYSRKDLNCSIINKDLQRPNLARLNLRLTKGLNLSKNDLARCIFPEKFILDVLSY
jgi:hypothetical protein